MSIENKEIHTVETKDDNLPKTILPKDWLENKTENKPDNQLKAVLCLEHLIQNYYYNQDHSPKIVEIGPVGMLNTKVFGEHKAPISLLSQRNKDFHCLALGPQSLSSKNKKELLGNVEYIEGLLSKESMFNQFSDSLIKKLGGTPDIIYGQHVFESSPGSETSLPLGPYKIFEKSAEILAPNGFIVVDNYGGKQNQIGIEKHWPHSKNMKLAYSYIYEENKGIYVFKKEELKINNN